MKNHVQIGRDEIDMNMLQKLLLEKWLSLSEHKIWL